MPLVEEDDSALSSFRYNRERTTWVSIIRLAAFLN